MKVKKTGIVRSNSCPQYSQSFHFKIEDSLLDITSLCVTILEVFIRAANEPSQSFTVPGGTSPGLRQY